MTPMRWLGPALSLLAVSTLSAMMRLTGQELRLVQVSTPQTILQALDAHCVRAKTLGILCEHREGYACSSSSATHAPHARYKCFAHDREQKTKQ
jgi:hypothetical protein